MSDTLFSNQSESFPSAKDNGEYFFPPLSLLPNEASPAEEALAACNEGCDALLKALEQLKIAIEKQVAYTYTPTVIRYEVHPTSQKSALALLKSEAELALILRSSKIRIYNCNTTNNSIAIEIPNCNRPTLHLREVLESDTFVNATGNLNVAIGLDTTASNVVLDIAKAPHILIGGTTGSGKSVFIDNVLLSLMYTKTPNDVKLILIDPKGVEFSFYKDLPHLLTPIITSPKKAVRALQAIVEIMEKRFELLTATRTLSIDDYNKKMVDDVASAKLPHIVVIIDEFADLMLMSRKQIEPLIALLAQKARATGIHLVIATQRIAKDVFTDVILANIPTHIALATTCVKDSRLILGCSGAEKLQLNGDMLLLANGSTDCVRAQCCYVSCMDIGKICEYIRNSNAPVAYDEDFIARIDE